jgi:hypothetical protein
VIARFQQLVNPHSPCSSKLSSSKQRLPGSRYGKSFKHISKESTNTKDDAAQPKIKKQVSRFLSLGKVGSGLLRRKAKENKENAISRQDPEYSPPPTKPRLQSRKP